MKRITSLAILTISLLVLPAFAGGSDDTIADSQKRIASAAGAKGSTNGEAPMVNEGGGVSSQKIEPPVSAGGTDIEPVLIRKDGSLADRRHLMITTAPMPPMVRKVSVLIESDPSNSGIEVDGVFVGVTPVQVTLKEGVHQMKLSLAGYLSWQRTVKAYNGLYVNVKLAQESSRKSDITESASAK